MKQDLRKTVKHLLVDYDLDRRADILLPAVSEKLGRKVNKSSYHNAMSGYRTGPASQEILAAIRDVILSAAHESSMEAPGKQA
jgi:hypothetical protein